MLDPFVGSGTTLVAAEDTDRHAVGFDLKPEYVELSTSRVNDSQRTAAICDDARNIPSYVEPESLGLIFTSPPYANLLNPSARTSRAATGRQAARKVERYSQDPRDLGILELDQYAQAMGDTFEALLPLLRPKAHCVINVPDMWWEDSRITIHVALIEELRTRGYELRNVIIWDRTNIVNRVGIFGWPSNYITMGVTFEYSRFLAAAPGLTETSRFRRAGVLKPCSVTSAPHGRGSGRNEPFGE